MACRHGGHGTRHSRPAISTLLKSRSGPCSPSRSNTAVSTAERAGASTRNADLSCHPARRPCHAVAPSCVPQAARPCVVHSTFGPVLAPLAAAPPAATAGPAQQLADAPGAAVCAAGAVAAPPRPQVATSAVGTRVGSGGSALDVQDKASGLPGAVLTCLAEVDAALWQGGGGVYCTEGQ